MDYQVDFQESFLEDLEQIVRTIAAENSAAAQKLGELVVNASEALAFFPERHPRVRRRLELRRFVIAGRYKVFYRVRPSTKVVENSSLLGWPPRHRSGRLKIKI